ncbi:MAG: MATE family efflux transporter [Clostridia bacterium]|nr:MATE family efflux transporter [Clostridia bacterium]
MGIKHKEQDMSVCVRQTPKRDFTKGRVLKNLILFSIPMAIATLLQVLFNAADVAIVGRFAGHTYQAAVGGTSSTVHLIVNLFIGVSIGVNVAMANAFGAKDEARQYRIVHSAMALALVSGIVVLIIGVAFSRYILQAIDVPPDVIRLSTLYLRIYFLGAPAIMIYNFGASLLRAVGETKKPLYYLLVAGVLNVVINVVTVVFLDMHVVGVGLGTVISQYVSAVWVVVDLIRAKGTVKYTVKKTRFYKAEVKNMLFIGIPSGISSCLFSLSNVLLQAQVNQFGSVALAGRSVGASIDTFCDAVASSVEKGVVTFVGQNVGANKRDRINRIVGAGLLACACIQLVYGMGMLLFGEYVCGLYNQDPAVIEEAMKWVMYISATQAIMSVMYVFGATLRGMGYSVFPMLINLFFICCVRLGYVWVIYPLFSVQTIEKIYLIYPITWVLSGGVQSIAYYCIRRAEKRRKQEQDKTLKEENVATA